MLDDTVLNEGGLQAPDEFVRLGGPDEPFDTSKTWERGVPELCVEIASDSDAREWANTRRSSDAPSAINSHEEVGCP